MLTKCYECKYEHSDEGVMDFTEELGGNAERRLKGSCHNESTLSV